ncbi:MAG: MFS transporter [Desulfobulbaceae bacterium]|uniref:MFS transporter n=1 Tax=Candidatus Desulfatifera sulfidica TaxID=2841691 RepID=A0A8J6T9M0_9BACT|nr:MFS transporter [Candidatus Desulfatifera sulfidica]
MYDWANSAYMTTIAVGILPMYFAAVVVPPQGFLVGETLFAAETLWGFMASAAAFIIFLFAPTLGAIADFSATRKRFLFSFCYLGVISATLLSFCGPGQVWLTIVLFVISQIGFVGANVFYDAFLPHIAMTGQENRVSSKGFAYGYAGGAIQFGCALILIAAHDLFGITEESAARLGMLSAALWWGGFALISACLLQEKQVAREIPRRFAFHTMALTYPALGLSRVWQTMGQVKHQRHLLLFLLAFLVYNEGIQTVIIMATIYGRQELHLSATALMCTLLLVQVVAIPGALFFAWIAEKTNSKKAILLSLVTWSAVVVYAYFIQTETEYLVLGGIVGLVLGGSQAISRSFYASIIPKDSSAEFFAFYSVVSKFSAVLGPFIFGLMRHWSGSSRNAILSLISFFILGIILLQMVDEDKARKNRSILFRPQ